MKPWKYIPLAILALCAIPVTAFAAPAHDDIADAAIFDGLPFEMEIDTTGATNEEFEASLTGEGDCADNPGVWAQFTLPETTTVIAVIDGPQDAAVSLFEGGDPESLSFIYCLRSLDGRPGSSDGNLHTLEGGETYSLRFAAADTTEGSFDFSLGVATGIQGVVRNEEGDALGNTLVWASDAAHRKIAAACSYEDGRYRVSGLLAGTYRLEYTIRGCGSADPGAREWWRNATSFADATPVVVGTTEDTTGVDAVLGPKPEPEPEPSDTDAPEPKPEQTESETPTAPPAESDEPTVDPTAVGRRGEGGSAGLVAGLLVVVVLLGSGVGAAYVARRRA